MRIGGARRRPDMAREERRWRRQRLFRQPRRHPWRIVAGALLAIALLWVGYVLLTDGNATAIDGLFS